MRTSDDIRKLKYILFRGEDQSGKTKLCSQLFLEIAESNKPVLFIDLEEIKSKKAKEDIFEQKYKEQFHGDYALWSKQDDKTVIFDNLTSTANSLGYIAFAKQLFDHVYVVTSNDNYRAYFKDELAFSDFNILRLATLTHNKQEILIKKWLKFRNAGSDESLHAQVDQLERNINSIIINNKVLPRYPFFILSILQTYEIFMPKDLEITAYGHCYYALILAHLIKSGIDKRDDYIDPCFNFASQLAFEIHTISKVSGRITAAEYESFVSKYKEKYLINDSLVSRMTGPNGIIKITSNGHCNFTLPYSYYFFLGRHLANTYSDNKVVVDKIVEKSYVRDNTLSLIFAIHHAQNIEILDDILLHTVCAIESVEPSRLDKNETDIFRDLMTSIPHRILSTRSVEEERQEERMVREKNESYNDQDDLEESDSDFANQIFKSQKNMEVLSQILKNKAGSLEKNKIEEIIEIICDAGLRLVNLFLCDQDEIEEITKFVEKKFKESSGYDPNKGAGEQTQILENLVRYVIFVWTMTNIEKIVSSISKPELKGIVKTLREKKNTPAYDIICYFYRACK